MSTSLPFLLIAALLVSSLAFWALFFTVVVTRLGDANVKVKDSRWSFLVTRWPSAELRAYRSLLAPGEHRKWHNWYLFNASKLVAGLLLALFITLGITRFGP